MAGVARVLDANANRAREALRVLEDAARFHLDDEGLSRELKDMRHALQTALGRVPEGWLVAHRAAAADVGQGIAGRHEGERADYHAVVAAAGKRLGEALRSVEECLKVCAPAAAPEVERLRYRAYAAEAALVLRLGSARRRQWRVCVLITERLCARPWLEVARAALEGGADALQVREKELPAREIAARTRALVTAAHRVGAAVVVNDRADIALACGADGVHLGAEDLGIADARRLAGTRLLIGASTHTPEEADRAVAEGADYCGVGAMFATGTKPGVAPRGADALRAYLGRHGAVPHLAIGGITPGNVGALAAAGARGVAVSVCVCGADDPAGVVRALRAALDGAAP
jgi:thiamine-phosphate pyrophosphorylase